MTREHKSRDWDPQKSYQNPSIAATYDADRFTSLSGRRGNRRERNSFLRALARIPGVRTALDVPCGTGRMTCVLLEQGLATTGLDISLEMMQQAQPRIRTYETSCGLVRGSITRLPFPSNAFDLVTCVRLFGHFPSDVRVAMLREIARVSHQYVIVQYFYETSLTRLKRWVKRRILHSYEGVVHPVTKSQLAAEIRDSGLTEVRRFYCRRYYSEEVFVLAHQSGTTSE